jgi:hypothetical protein
MAYAQFDFPEPLSDVERKKRMVLSQMRGQTLSIRNWAFPEQTVRHLQSLFSGRLAEMISTRYGGVSIGRLIEVMGVFAALTDLRLNDHFHKVMAMATAKDLEAVCANYAKAFPGTVGDRDQMRGLLNVRCGGDLESLKSMLMVHSDLFLPHAFVFSLEDVLDEYGERAPHDGVAAILNTWSYAFGELASADPKHFLYSNPVLSKPLVRLPQDPRLPKNGFFWVLGAIWTHTLPSMLELLIPPEQRQVYVKARSQYLEDQVESLCRKSFPDGQVFRGSRWRPPSSDATEYENDVLVVIDSTAIVIECKAHLVDPPAKRGGEDRLVSTLKDVVVSAAVQAQRFVEFLHENPTVHAFTTRRGPVNSVDATRLLRFIPLSVTYENLGFVSSNLKRSVDAGLIDSPVALVPSICFTDLEVILETLDSQAQRIHYLSRRSEIERTMNYLGDESDLFALYLDSGFNLGDWEDGKAFVNVTMKSKELDSYFMAKEDGVSVPKPRLRLTKWWNDILVRIETVRKPLWTELAYIVLSVGRSDQAKLERAIKRLLKRVQSGRVPKKHNWQLLVTSQGSKRKYAVIGYPYKTDSRDERNGMIQEMAAMSHRLV